MNKAFADLLTARLIEITQDLRFFHKPSGILKAPQVVGTMLSEKDRSYQEGDEFPLVRWAAHQGVFTFKASASFAVILDGGIYTDGDIAAGTADIAALTMALGKITDKPWFQPYKLSNRVPFQLGSPEKNSLGIQPHPYYFTRLNLEFVVARGHGG